MQQDPSSQERTCLPFTGGQALEGRITRRRLRARGPAQAAGISGSFPSRRLTRGRSSGWWACTRRRAEEHPFLGLDRASQAAGVLPPKGLTLGWERQVFLLVKVLLLCGLRET